MQEINYGALKANFIISFYVIGAIYKVSAWVNKEHTSESTFKIMEILQATNHGNKYLQHILDPWLIDLCIIPYVSVMKK